MDVPTDAPRVTWGQLSLWGPVRAPVSMMAASFAALWMSAGPLEARGPSRLEIERAVRSELTRHPAATLRDLYKFFFQGAFGPGHMVTNVTECAEWIREEAREADAADRPPWQPVGLDGRFVRVDLAAVSAGEMDAADLARAVVASARRAPPVDPSRWRREWAKILRVIRGMDLDLPDVEADRTAIEGALARGHPVMHHSAVFEEHYHPHYRLVDREGRRALEKASSGGS